MKLTPLMALATYSTYTAEPPAAPVPAPKLPLTRFMGWLKKTIKK